MKNREPKRLISSRRVIEENLEWQDVKVKLDEPCRDPWNGAIVTHAIAYQIIDPSGTIYDGIIEEDGRVTAFGGYGHYDSVKTHDAFEAAEDAGISKRYGPRGRTRHRLYYNAETGEVFGRASSGADEEIYSMSACDVAAWLSDIDDRDEPVTYDYEPAAGDGSAKCETRSIAIGLPVGIVGEIERRLPGHPIDWIRCILAEALGDITLAGPPVGKPEERDPALTAEQVREALDRIKTGEATPAPDQPAPRTAEQIREVIERIKARKSEHDNAS